MDAHCIGSGLFMFSRRATRIVSPINRNHQKLLTKSMSSSSMDEIDYLRVRRPDLVLKDDRSSKSFTGNQISRSSNQSGAKIGPQRVWTARPPHGNTSQPSSPPTEWTSRVIDSAEDLQTLIARIEAQEIAGGRMRQRQLGVLHEDPATDMQLLTDNYTVKAVASALRDREDALQHAAVLAGQENWPELAKHLQIFHPQYVLSRRRKKHGNINLLESLSREALELLRKSLMRMPRTVTQAHSKRAGVVIALCTVQGKPCVLLEKRSPDLRAHPDEVCLPGGMWSELTDANIVFTCLREMEEEIGGLPSSDNADVLGVFRCNWGEVHHLVNIAVTPVVVCLGELPEELHPNIEEVAEVFTVPLTSLADKSLWIHQEGLAPIFIGAPYPVWGLTGYILERFYKDILLPNISSPTLQHSVIT